jgi:hypothetical protein
VTLRDDNLHMSDLSNLLGDVYGDSSPDGPPVRREPAASERAPVWSEDARLDRAFAGWEPEARGGFDDAVTAPANDSALADALSAALGTPATPTAPFAEAVHEMPAPSPAPAAPKAAWTAAPAAAPAPVAAPAAAAPARMWTPGDDDIFPMRGKAAKR